MLRQVKKLKLKLKLKDKYLKPILLYIRIKL